MPATTAGPTTDGMLDPPRGVRASTATASAPRSATRNASSCSGPTSRRSRSAGPEARRTGPTSTTLRDRIIKLGEQRQAMTDAMLDVAIKRAVAAIAGYIDRAVAERRVSGELDFHDLLVLARTLLRDPDHGAAARDAAPAPLRTHPDRRVPGHRPHPGRAGRAARVERSRRRCPAVAGDEHRPRPPVLRRRPEAVDLPVPARRHRDLPRRGIPLRRPGAAVPHLQLPDRARRCSRGSTTSSRS